MGFTQIPQEIVSTGKVWKKYGHYPSPNGYQSITGNRSTGRVGNISTQVYYYNNTYIFGTAFGLICYSTDAKNWNYQIVFPSNGYISAIAYNGTTFVVVGQDNLCYTGTPGGTWTARTSGLSGTAAINDCKWVGGSINLFVICGAYTAVSSARITTSPDGITWTARYTANTFDCTTIAVNTSNNVIIVTTQANTSGLNALSSTNGTTWSNVNVYGAAYQTSWPMYYMPHADSFTCMKSSYRKASSAIGTNWSAAPVSTQQQPSQLIEANKSNVNPLYKRWFPIWDSVNQQYYVLNGSLNTGFSMITFDNMDPVGYYQTGSEFSYQWNVKSIDSLPTTPQMSSVSTDAIGSDAGALGYGNGIWVYVQCPYQNANQQIPVIYSTAV